MSKKTDKCRVAYKIYCAAVENDDIMHRLPEYFDVCKKKLIEFVNDGWTEGRSFYKFFGLHPDSYLYFEHDDKSYDIHDASIAVPPSSFYSMVADSAMEPLIPN